MKMSTLRRAVAGVVAPLCGVTMTLGRDQNGLSDGSGSTPWASRPAPAIQPSRSAMSRASSSAMPPREMQMKYAVAFIAWKAAEDAQRLRGTRGGDDDEI